MIDTPTCADKCSSIMLGWVIFLGEANSFTSFCTNPYSKSVLPWFLWLRCIQLGGSWSFSYQTSCAWYLPPFSSWNQIFYWSLCIHWSIISRHTCWKCLAVFTVWNGHCTSSSGQISKCSERSFWRSDSVLQWLGHSTGISGHSLVAIQMIVIKSSYRLAIINCSTKLFICSDHNSIIRGFSAVIHSMTCSYDLPRLAARQSEVTTLFSGDSRGRFHVLQLTKC